MDVSRITMPVAAGIGLSITAAVSYFYLAGTSTGQDEQAMLAQPVALVRAPQVQAPRFVPGDTVSLSREIQRELKRVGCYQGAVNGIWTPATRVAMQSFIDAVNAKLPTAKPDEILLSLVIGQQSAVCGSCPSATSFENGCSADVTTASTAPTPVVDSQPVDVPIIRAGAAKVEPVSRVKPEFVVRETDIEAALAEPSPKTRDPAPASDQRVSFAPAIVSPAATRPETAAVFHGSSEPQSAGIEQRSQPAVAEDVQASPAKVTKRKHRTARVYQSKPPKFMRSFIRNVKGTLASFGIR